jgi:hypothetical protein
MRERPILFSAPMVRAILAGQKTQTRRAVKGLALDWLAPGNFTPAYVADPENHACPYGQPGDRLWVRETFRLAESLDSLSPAAVAEKCLDAGYRIPWAPIQYEVDGQRRDWRSDFNTPPRETEPGKTRQSIHMPRWASRITLEITGVRVERLQAIGARDAIAEGIPAGGPENPDGIEVRDFRALWLSINGAGSWESDPWVWVVEFKRLETGS